MRRRTRWWLAAVTVALAGALAWEVHTPSQVAWEPVSLPGCSALKAEGLVLQQEDGHTVWASRGWDIYRSQEGGPFQRVATLHPPAGEAWGGYLRTLRSSYGYQELVEVLPLRPDLLLVFGGGSVYRLDLPRGTQEHVLTLRYFGRGKGRGVMSRIARDEHDDVYFGEYSDVWEDHTIRIWRGSDEARTWSVAYEFPAGQALHAHGVQWDPHAHALWVMTGDTDAQSRIGFSNDGGAHFEWIASGNQSARACSLVFTPEAVMWATDTEDNHLVRWSRSTHAITVLADLPAQSLYAEPLDEGRSLIGQSAWDASVYLLGDDGALFPVARFTPEPQAGRPIPGMRLARGAREARPWVEFNPLRTEQDEAAIYRVAMEDVRSCSPPPPRWTHRP
ncbi:MAG TPA: hypothetical protein VIF15_17130 [Polyangiaceae bacterium]|jgi:hypothetical protein